MRKIITLFAFILVLGANAQTTLIHYWNFKSFVGISTASAVSVVTTPLTPYPADSTILPKGNPSVIYQALPGTSSSYQTFWTQGGGAASAAGTSLNYVQFPGSETQDTNYCMKASNPSDQMELLFSIPTTGYKNIAFSYAYELSSAKAPQVAYYDYSVDGGKTFDSTGLSLDSIPLITTPKQFYLISISIKNVAVENNPNLIFRIRQGNPNTGSSGNDRYANVQVTGTPTGLPLLLQSFNGAIVNNEAKLSWTSLNEVNVEGYEVESSTNNLKFEKAKFVSANGFKGINTYTFLSIAPNITTYYRLKMIDKDGSFAYSPLIVLNVAVKKLQLYPNPVVNTVTLSHEEAVVGALIKVLSIDGKVIAIYNTQIGSTQSRLDVSKMVKGSYIVSFENNGSRITTQFVK